MSRYLTIFIISIVLFSFVSISGSTEKHAVQEDIDVVWSSSDGLKMEIYYSQRQHDFWSEPVRVTDDHYDNVYPVVDRDSSGKRWIFWSAYDNGRMELHYTTGRGEEWQDSEVLEADKETNISPSVVIDKEDRVWVVWSANDGLADDIMYAYFQDGSWSDPATVHGENELPDMLPVIEIDPAGSPSVTWRASRNGENITLASRWVDGQWSEPEIQKIETEEDQDPKDKMLELPSFMNKSSMVFIRVY